MSFLSGKRTKKYTPVKGLLRSMLRFSPLFCLLLLFSLSYISVVHATSTQFGETGLLSQPTAQTLHEGNICVGIWANCSDGVDNGSSSSDDSGLIVPTTITMGLGTFMEVYGSYPNLLFNDDEGSSGRGFANVGFKFRVYGKRSDSFRLAVDLQGRQSISDDPDFDGLTDYVSRFIATIRWDTFAVHANAGYAFNESPNTVDYDDQILFGSGVEYSFTSRLRMIAEFSADTEKISDLGSPSEVTAGFQYFITPHLTMNLGTSVGLSDASPDWRVLLGLTTCQGVGFFNRPVPKLIDPDEVVEEPVEKTIKVIKIRILTPLLSKASVADTPVGHLEIPVDDTDEAFIIDPADRLRTPESESLEVSPIGSIGSQTPAVKSPLPVHPFPAKVRRHFRFPEMTFSSNQWALSEEGRRSISLVAEELRKDNKYFIISIEGHTDNVGSETYNQTLSFKRAVAAATHLVLRDGFSPARLFVKGHGESRPIEDNASEEGRALNRRVEFLILVPEGFEDVEIDTHEKKVMLQKDPVIDPLAIEQAIMEKTGAETAVPMGAFSQSGKADKN